MTTIANDTLILKNFRELEYAASTVASFTVWEVNPEPREGHRLPLADCANLATARAVMARTRAETKVFDNRMGAFIHHPSMDSAGAKKTGDIYLGNGVYDMDLGTVVRQRAVESASKIKQSRCTCN